MFWNKIGLEAEDIPFVRAEAEALCGVERLRERNRVREISSHIYGRFMSIGLDEQCERGPRLMDWLRERWGVVEAVEVVDVADLLIQQNSPWEIVIICMR
jgi:hypothetical protein